MSESVELSAVLQAIDDEEELDGPMPDEIYEAIGDRVAMAHVLRAAVRLTKQSIRERIERLPTNAPH